MKHSLRAVAVRDAITMALREGGAMDDYDIALSISVVPMGQKESPVPGARSPEVARHLAVLESHDIVSGVRKEGEPTIWTLRQWDLDLAEQFEWITARVALGSANAEEARDVE